MVAKSAVESRAGGAGVPAIHFCNEPSGKILQNVQSWPVEQ
jgi:hypothetical protein